MESMLVVMKLICFVEKACNLFVNDAFQDFDDSTGKTVQAVVKRSVLASLLEHWCYVCTFLVTWQGNLFVRKH